MTPVVLVLVLANVAVYLLQGIAGDLLMGRFALWPIGRFFDPSYGGMVGFEPWQLITSAFLHDPGNIAHVLLNMFALLMFGRDVEKTLGSARFLGLYGASVVAGSLAQLLVTTMTLHGGVFPTVGASGGVFGVLLAFAIFFPRRRLLVFPVPVPLPAWFVVTAYGLIELYSGVTGTQQGVAHFAHLGGMVGAAMVLLLPGRRPPARPS